MASHTFSPTSKGAVAAGVQGQPYPQIALDLDEADLEGMRGVDCLASA